MEAHAQAGMRHLAARLVAVVLALVAMVVLMGLIDLLTLLGWVDQQYVWEVPLEASWGALFTFFLSGAYIWVALFPRTPTPAFLQLAISAVALAVSAVAGTDWRPLAVAVGVVASGLVLWLLLGRPGLTGMPRPAVRRAPLVVGVVGLPLWLPYALDAFAQSRSGVLGTITQGIEHWPVQGAAAVAIVLASFAMGLSADGRPLLRVAVSLSAVYIGMAELAYPDRLGAVGSLLWGVGVTLWGLLVALVVVPSDSPREEQPHDEGRCRE